jgi:hypothetical protein
MAPWVRIDADRAGEFVLTTSNIENAFVCHGAVIRVASSCRLTA